MKQYVIRVENRSPKSKSPYTMTLGPYTRKNDAITGLARMELPNLRNAKVHILTGEDNLIISKEDMISLTPKTLTTSGYNYRTHKKEGIHTYKFSK